MKKKLQIDWIHHGIELIVVFISISLAFIVNQCRDDYQNARLEEKYLQSFREDIAADLTTLDSMIVQNERYLENLRKLIGMIKAKDLANDSLFENTVALIGISRFFPNQSTYQSIISNGNFGVISDYRLKQQISKYYQELGSRELIESVYQLHLNEYVLPFFYQNVDLLEGKVIALEALQTPAFSNLVAGSFTLLNQNTRYYRTLRELAGELKVQLDQAVIK